MKRPASLCLATMVIAALTVTPVMAQRGGAGAGRGGGMGGGMGGSMGRGASPTHGSPEIGMGARHGTSGMDGGAETGMDRRKTAGELLSQNTKLASRLGTLLPAGTDLQQAAGGFKNLGEFVAATHVSHNLGIPFENLKARTTGPDAISLGKAIKELKPEVDSKAEVKKAKKQAENDLQGNE